MEKSSIELIVEADAEGINEIAAPKRANFIPRINQPNTHQTSILRRRCSSNSVLL